MPAPRPFIAVVGSLNIDSVAIVDHLPRPGETIGTRGFEQHRGGKGANQALAIARQGARVALIGCVGDDDLGRDYTKFLQSEGVDTEAITQLRKRRTGAAMITVDRHGENQIVLVPGANAQLSASMVRKHAKAIRSATALLLQFETTVPAIVEACWMAHAANVPIVVNPAPWRSDFPWGTLPISTVVVNETEAAEFFRVAEQDFPSKRGVLFQRMKRWAITQVVITRGGRSSLCLRAGVMTEVAVLPVKPLDTVGAGDTFAGTLTVHLAEGDPLERATWFANCAAAMATLKLGAQASIPKRGTVDRIARKIQRGKRPVAQVL